MSEPLPNFDTLLDRLTGHALERLGQGSSLRDVIGFVMDRTAQWKDQCGNAMLSRIHAENTRDLDARDVEIERLRGENLGLQKAIAHLSPFNRLSPAEVERLAILMEEGSEVIQIACKILRHGYGSKHPADLDGPDNRGMLTKELGDLRAAMTLLTEDGDVVPSEIREAAHVKLERITTYLHHQEGEIHPIDLNPFMPPVKEPHAPTH